MQECREPEKLPTVWKSVSARSQRKSVKRFLERCGKIETLERLLSGDFPDDMKELFQGEDGLFPQPSEISFQCSCPDWALMCKHVAAALYGVGARLDTNPALFFELRGIEIGRFVDVALANRVERMLENAQKPSARIMDDEEAAQKLFGVFGKGIARDTTPASQAFPPQSTPALRLLFSPVSHEKQDKKTEW